MEAPAAPSRPNVVVPPWGRVLALFGAALVVLSSVLAWAQQPFAPPGTGIYPTQIPVPSLLTRSLVRIPTLGLVLSLLGLGAALLTTVPGRAADLGRRALGALVAVLVVLFVLRLSPAVGDRSLLSALLVGFYLAAAGASLTVLAGRSLRRS